MYKAVMAVSLLTGLSCGALLTFGTLIFMGYKSPDNFQNLGPVPSEAKVIGYYQAKDRLVATLSDGRIVTTTFFQKTPEGVTFTIGNEVFQEQIK